MKPKNEAEKKISSYSTQRIFCPLFFFFFLSSFQLEYKFKKQKIFLSKNFKKNKEKSKMKNTILNKKNPPSD